MKTILKVLYVVTLCMLTTPVLHAQQKEGYEITGHLAGLKDGTKVVMTLMDYHAGRDMQRIPIDSAYVKDGQFKITGVVPEGPRLYILFIFFEGGTKGVHLFIDNGQHITLRCDQDINKINHGVLDALVICEGSPTHFAYNLFARMGDALDATDDAIGLNLRKIRDSLGYDPTTVTYLLKVRHDFKEILFQRILNPMSADLLPAATFFALYEQGDHSAFWSDIYDQLDDHQKVSQLGKLLKQRLPLLEGQKLPGFTLPEQAGQKLSLDDIVKKGRVTLVYIWANNSAARKQYDVELREMYRKFHDKGLNIIAVSTESEEANWKAALATEKYPWYNVFDSKGKIVVDGVYHELGQVDHQNTTNVLLDKDGKIIAWDPTSIVLQYYVIKAFEN